jgi:hypothetical protein
MEAEKVIAALEGTIMSGVDQKDEVQRMRDEIREDVRAWMKAEVKAAVVQKEEEMRASMEAEMKASVKTVEEKLRVQMETEVKAMWRMFTVCQARFLGFQGGVCRANTA